MELTSDDDHETSEDAAEKISGQLQGIQAQVYKMFLIHKGLTDWELTEKCNQAHGKRQESTYRKRRSELTAMGLLMETAERRINLAGNRQKVWSLRPGAQILDTPIKKTNPDVVRLKRMLFAVMDHDSRYPNRGIPKEMKRMIWSALDGI